jgi:hypothetical protein
LSLISGFGWDGTIVDNAGKVINACYPKKVIISSMKDYVIHCALLQNDLSKFFQFDSLNFKIGTQT